MPMLKTCPCPRCQRPGYWLSALSRNARVDYYRCDSCVHVWNVPKDKSAPIQDVTQR
jgi:hypothetical protein